jgi:lactate permease
MVSANASLSTGLSVATLLVHIPGLDMAVFKPEPVGHLVASVWTVDLLAASGICIYLVALVVTFALYRMRLADAVAVYAKTLRRMSLSFATLMLLMAFGYVLKACGMDVTLGLAAATAGHAGVPFLSPVIGFLGVFLTGSATSMSVLFGSLQVIAAGASGNSAVQMAAACMVGGQIGHIISTPAMVVASVATGFASDGNLRPIALAVASYAVGLIAAFACWNALVALVFPGYVG